MSWACRGSQLCISHLTEQRSTRRCGIHERDQRPVLGVKLAAFLPQRHTNHLAILAERCSDVRTRPCGQSDQRVGCRGSIEQLSCAAALTLAQIIFLQLVDDAQPVAVNVPEPRRDVADPDRRRLLQVVRRLHRRPRATCAASHVLPTAPQRPLPAALPALAGALPTAESLGEQLFR